MWLLKDKIEAYKLQYAYWFLQYEAKISDQIYKENEVMTLKELIEKISKACYGCKQCDPSCTGYILKKCIENKRFAMPLDEHIVISN